MNRRQMIGSATGVAVAAAAGLPATSVFAASVHENMKLKGNIHHSVSQWCYGDIQLDDLAKACAEMGLESVELLGEKDWAVVKKHGLKCAVGYATDYGIP